MEGTSSTLDGMDSASVYVIHSMKCDLELLGEDSSSNYATPLTSPASSYTSYESCVSSLGDLLYDVNLQSWEGGSEETPDTCLCHFNPEFSEERVSENIYNETCYAENESKISNFPKLVEGFDNLGSGTEHKVEKEAEEFSLPLNIETDPHIWIPPEYEDDNVGIDHDNDVTTDNESSDTTQWSQPSSFGGCTVNSVGNNRFREEYRKAMMEVMNGRFRALVGRLLAWAGVSVVEDAGESWLDLVTSLSWEAAMLVRPENAEGKSMDPGNYVKVKCIESGSRSQSQVINGLVFKKNAAHKHMLTKYVNPTLLLLQGGIGPHVGSWSSLNSLEQEKKDYLKSIIDIIEQCHPNVILVEKTVSGDLQNFILQQGITLVSDMKLHRLERIARCTNSQIVPTSGDLVDLKLKTCGLFHIEKALAGHDNYGEGGKCPIKTLMFFEDCPRPLGCTILLKGAHNDELKRVKRVVQHAVPQAYHLIQENSFLVDQRVIFLSNRLINGCIKDKQLPVVSSTHTHYTNRSGVTCSAVGIASSEMIDIPVTDELSGMLGPDVSTPTHYSFKRKLDYPSLNIFASDLEVKSEYDLGGEKAKTCSTDIDKQVQMKHDVLEIALDTEWLLVLLTSRCVSKGMKKQCSKCSESSDFHSYSYCYHNGKLMISVKKLPPELLLPGEEKGILWMWTLCLKCNQSNGIPKPTRRVAMSSGARRLSFGKFLELCVSENSAINRLATCGHLLFRDCLQFYGLGSAVAMFSYSPIRIYSALGPPPVLEFCSPNGQGWLQIEAEHMIRSQVTGLSRKQPAKDFSEVEEMLMKEKSDFEASFQKTINENVLLGQAEHQILALNCLNHDLLLKLYVWDRRLQCLQLSMVGDKDTDMHEKQLQLQKDEISVGRTQKRDAWEHEYRPQEASPLLAPLAGSDVASLSFTDHNDSGSICRVEKELEIKGDDTSTSDGNLFRNVQISSSPSDDFLKSGLAGSEIHGYIDAGSMQPSDDPSPELLTSPSLIAKENHRYTATCDNMFGHKIPIRAGSTETNDVAVSNVKFGEKANCSALADNSVKPPVNDLLPRMVIPLEHLPSDLEDYERWVWSPFSEICKAYRKDIQGGHLQKFDFVNSYTPSYLFMANQLIAGERSRLYFPVDSDDNVVSIYEDELSSVVACAVALLRDRFHSTENMTEKNRNLDKGEVGKSTDDAHSLFSNSDAASSYGTSTGPSPLEGMPSQEVTELGSEGFFSVDSLLFSRALHPEVPLGIGKFPGRGKYSVICFYAKQFYNLRKRCCPSELDYISSICRSKKWNAQGGKSGALFAKTLDDRFIVKQIKKTELNSFLQFGPNYFKHILWCFDSRSQTCLAKILGIYQVIIRQSKNGKDVVVNLMVMENLFFGRNISCVYDLKGVIHSRYTSVANGTLLDQNFLQDVLASPYFVGEKTKQRLQRAIWNDTSFLTSINVMDYSLLLGVDEEHCELVYGIVDYLRQYTWDKHLETWVKASLVVPKNELPTVVSPKEYRKRFRKFITTYLFATPDHWFSYQNLGPSENCGNCSGNSQFDDFGTREKSSKRHFYSL
ncbi:hypothetical protein ACLOJK_033236 [Asimina triloba]